MADVIALFRSDYFVTGVRLGLIGLGLGWAVWAMWRSRVRPVPIVGLLVATVLIVTLHLVEGVLDGAIIPALVLMTAGVAVAVALRANGIVQAAAALPGSIWLALNNEVTDLVWVGVAIALFVPVAGYLVTDFELRHDGLGLGVIYYFLAALGVFGAIPDTEWAVALFGISLVLAFLAWPKTVGSLGPVGAYPAVAVLVWVAAQGGAARHASIVGAVASLGLLLLEPVVIALKPSAMRVSKSVRRNWVGAVVASIPQFLVVLICSRVAARFTNEWSALAVVGFVFAVVLVVGLMAGSGDQGGLGDAPAA